MKFAYSPVDLGDITAEGAAALDLEQLGGWMIHIRCDHPPPAAPHRATFSPYAVVTSMKQSGTLARFIARLRCKKCGSPPTHAWLSDTLFYPGQVIDPASILSRPPPDARHIQLPLRA